MKTIIQNAHVLGLGSDDKSLMDVGLDNGHIAFIGETPHSFVADRHLDAQGQCLMPGCVDLGTSLREPGLDHKATIDSETYAAMRSGITTLCYQPEPSVLVDNSAQVNLIRQINNELGYAHIEVIGNFTKELQGKTLSNMGGLKRAGCIAVTNGWQPFKDLSTQRLAMEYAATHDIPVFIFSMETSLRGEGVVHEGAVSTRAGFAGIPSAAESVAVAQTLALMEVTGARVHFCRLSAADSVQMIRRAKRDGLPVTADVAAHQLFLTEMDISDFNPLCHVIPPLRSQRDVDALIEGLADDTIDAICSDHQPHEIDAKLAPFQQTEAGISALETLLPLTLRLVENKQLSLEQAVCKLTRAPADIIQSSTGRMEVGAPADLVLVNLDTVWDLTLERLHSMGKNTPFLGWSFKGAVQQTWLNGRNIYRAE